MHPLHYNWKCHSLHILLIFTAILWICGVTQNLQDGSKQQCGLKCAFNCPKIHGRPCKCIKFDNYYQLVVSCGIDYLHNETNFGIGYDSINCTKVKLNFTCNDNHKVSVLNGSKIQNLLPESLQRLGLELHNCNLTSLHEDSFKNMNKLIILTIANCNLKYIEPRTFVGTPNLTQANFGGNALRGIDGKYISWPARLSNLLISFNSQPVLGSSIFHNLLSLQNLSLVNNGISRIPQGAFQWAANLQTLELQNNKINKVEKHFFEGLVNLTVLNLCNNYITSIEDEAFILMPKLVDLNLRQNSLLNINTTSLKGLKSLSILTLSNNDITHLTYDNFNGTPNLRHLYLSNNTELFEVDFGAFSGLANLEELQLNYNNLTEVYKNQMHLNNVHKIKLDNNRLTHIPDGLFKMFPHVLWVHLDENNFTNITKGMIQGLDVAISVNLGFCHIDTIEPNIFTNIHYLVNLVLRHNQITHIQTHTFKGLSSLQFLLLNYNYINRIESGAFANMRFLRNVDLRHNNLTCLSYNVFPISFYHLYILLDNNFIDTIENLAFEHIRMLSVHLHGNKLTVIKKQAFSYVAQGPGKHSMHRSFHIGGNPLHCTCHMRWLNSSWDVKNIRIADVSKLYCQKKLVGQLELQKVKLAHVPPPEYYCLVGGISLGNTPNCGLEGASVILNGNHSIDFQLFWPCPAGCKCYSNCYYLQLIQAVECNIKTPFHNLSKFPTIPATLNVLLLTGYTRGSLNASVFPFKSKLVNISIPRNNIQALPCKTFANTPFLELLDLRENNLKKLSGCTFKEIKNLKWLLLSNNNLNAISENAFNALKTLRTLYLNGNCLQKIEYTIIPHENLNEMFLGGNTWDCDCLFGSAFKSWVYSNRKFIKDRENMTCSKVKNNSNVKCSASNTLMDCDFRNCADHWRLVRMMGISLGFFIVVFLMVFGIYYHKERVQVFMYHHFNVRFKKTKELEGKVFDAFICYSKEDGCRIMRDILGVLEHGTGTQYKVCIDARDWRAGGSVSEAIIQSIQASRRVIFILTEQFLASQWCEFEFQFSHGNFIEDRSTKLLPVVVGDAAFKAKSRTLSHYLKTRIFLKWGSKSFWRKLKYFMPDMSIRDLQGELRDSVQRARRDIQKNDTELLLTESLGV